jgi:hypothetical protein
LDRMIDEIGMREDKMMGFEGMKILDKRIL